ncbi:MAG: HNH endonuclease, partial [Pseudomonadota bacterium]
MSAEDELGPCPLCGRPMVAGPTVNRHHLVPRSEGGRATVWLHRICHAKLHAVLDERELATAWADPASWPSHPDLAAFARWVKKRP